MNYIHYKATSTLAREKKVPENGSYEFTMGLLQALFDFDGTVTGKSTVGLSIRLCQVHLERLETVLTRRF